MAKELALRHYTAAEAQELVDQLVEVYLDAHVDDGPLYNEDRYRHQLAMHMTRNGWTLVAASIERELAGYTYGFPLAADTRWWEGIQGPIPAGFTDEDGRRTFALCELLIRPRWRRQGFARALHLDLLSGRPEDRATLLVRPDNNAAHAAYSSWGWQSVAKLKPNWHQAPTFDILVKNM